MRAPATSKTKIDPCIVRARKVVAKATPKTDFIRKHFAKGRPNSSHDSTTEGTIKALDLLLKAYKKFYPLS